MSDLAVGAVAHRNDDLDRFISAGGLPWSRGESRRGGIVESQDYVGVAVCTLVMGVVFWNLVLLRRGIGPYDERPEKVWQAILQILSGTTTPPIGLFFGFMAGILLDLWSGTPGLFIVVGLMLLSFVVAASTVLTGRPRWVVPPPVRPWPGARRIDAGEVYPSPDSAALDANQTL